jgi:phosphate starvation-inducible PhoH-like protein
LSEIILSIDGVDPLELYGEKNSKLNLLRQAYPNVKITSRGSNVKISSESKKEAQAVKGKFEMMIRLLKEQHDLTKETIKDLLNGSNPFDTRISNGDTSNSTLVHGRGGKVIKPKTRNQKKLVEASERSDIVFAIGPAGTGKTYTAVAIAVRALKNRLVKKIILTRPAVEAGESLGFLPGDLKDKVDPYLRPLYDALDDMLPLEKLNFFMTNRVIEVAPLAFMRGRTLDNAFIILDEAQNATPGQLKMFLTRIGPSAKCIITGDLTQIDLPYNQVSGLRQNLRMLEQIDGIESVYLTAEDVVRHRLVKEIIKAYDRDANERKARREAEKQAKESGPAKENKPTNEN